MYTCYSTSFKTTFLSFLTVCESFTLSNQSTFKILHLIIVKFAYFSILLRELYNIPLFFFFPQYGLYGCFLGCFIYIFLGSSKDVPVGPTAISALLTFQAAQGSWERAVLLSFLTGLIEIAMGIFQLGFLIDFVSGPVSAGFTSAVSLIIFTSQFKDLLGVNTKGDTFVKMWISIVKDISNIRWNDAGFGLCCIVVLLSMRVMASTTFGPKEGKTGWQKFLSGFFWLIGTSRNAVLVIATGGIGYALVNSGNDIFRMVGYVPKGLPHFQAPPFSMDIVTNDTITGEIITTHETFSEMVANLGSGLIVVPLISLLENMSVVSAFGEYEIK